MNIHRIHNINFSSQHKPQYIVIGGKDVEYIAKAEPDRRNKNKYYVDHEVPIIWYACGGSIADQRDILIYKVIPDLLLIQDQTVAQILWIPSHEARINTAYECDIMQILDSIMKVTEFNLVHKTTYKVGLAKSWFTWGAQCDEENL